MDLAVQREKVLLGRGSYMKFNLINRLLVGALFVTPFGCEPGSDRVDHDTTVIEERDTVIERDTITAPPTNENEGLGTQPDAGTGTNVDVNVGGQPGSGVDVNVDSNANETNR